MEDLKVGEIHVVNEGKALLIDLVGLTKADSAVDKLEMIYVILKAVRDGRDRLLNTA